MAVVSSCRKMLGSVLERAQPLWFVAPPVVKLTRFDLECGDLGSVSDVKEALESNCR